jgi:hypothetical protein
MTTKKLTYRITGGSLPSGLYLSESTGTITGGPTGSFTFGGTTSTFTVQASDGVNSVSRTFNITRKWYDGSSAALAGTSAQKIKNDTGVTTNGDYWIQPTGQAAYQIYCDMSTNSGAWMCVAVGRQGRQDNTGVGSWWRDLGDRDSLFSTGLKQTNLSGSGNYTPRYLPVSWIYAALGTSFWPNIQMIVNRIELGDSWFIRGNSAGPDNVFTWSAFNPGGGTDSGASTSYSNRLTRYGSQWIAGSATHDTSTTGWVDYNPSNDGNRIFTWTWSGHSGWNGWSAGSSISSPGFQAGVEGHALQMVNVFVRS